MKLCVALFLLSHSSEAFVTRASSRSHGLLMAVDTPPPPAVQKSGQPTDVRYSDFLKMIDKDQIEKVTFSADGSQLLGVDTEGGRLKLEALPNDPDLLDQLTKHKVRARRFLSPRI